MNDLHFLFNRLEKTQLKGYNATAIPIYNYHRIGKDNDGNPIIFLNAHSSGNTSFPNIQLKNLSVNFNIRCKISIGSVDEENNFTVISLISEQEELKSYFLELMYLLILTLGKTPTLLDIQREIYRFIDLFTELKKTPLKSVQGLWAELLIIEQSNDLQTFIQSWHKEPTAKYDFTHKFQNLEVKSTSSRKRQHHFSIEQLTTLPSNFVTIASVFVEQTNNGMCIEDIKNKIVAKIPNEFELQYTINLIIAKTLGSSVTDVLNVKFNYELAVQSIAFYDAQNIPTIRPQHIAQEISDIHFKVDLSNLPQKQFTF